MNSSPTLASITEKSVVSGRSRALQQLCYCQRCRSCHVLPRAMLEPLHRSNTDPDKMMSPTRVRPNDKSSLLKNSTKLLWLLVCCLSLKKLVVTNQKHSHSLSSKHENSFTQRMKFAYGTVNGSKYREMIVNPAAEDAKDKFILQQWFPKWASPFLPEIILMDLLFSLKLMMLSLRALLDWSR